MSIVEQKPNSTVRMDVGRIFPGGAKWRNLILPTPKLR